jgi:hypothetical protein
MADRGTLFEPPVRADICIDRSGGKVQGGFKQALFGTAAMPNDLFKAGLDLCLKQTFYRKEGSWVAILHPSANQVIELSVEANCMAWAIALFALVEDFVTSIETIDSETSPCWTEFSRPKMHFVQAGIAVEQGEGDTLKVYLVEERIPGKFIKLIHNCSAQVSRLHSEADMDFVLYVSFSQHVQYQETNKLVFISDYQGEYRRHLNPHLLIGPTV